MATAVLGAVLAFASTAAPAGAAPTATSRPPACSAPFDVLTSPASLLAECGVKVFPERPGPSGAPTYRLGGATVSYNAPPAGFDATAAAPGRLALYGIPPAPPAGAALLLWRQRMAKLHFVAAPRFLAEVTAHAASSMPDFSDHWAGYVAYGGPFRRTVSTWVEPRLRPSRCRLTALTIWAGIGGYATPQLAQDGTAENTPEIGQNQAWWELTPAGMVPVPLYATVGAQFTANVTYIGQGRFAFFMENDRTGAAWSQVEQSTNGVSLSTAEAIVERPCLANCAGDNARYANLSNFGRTEFTEATVDGAPIQALSTYAENMSDNGVAYGHNLARPGPLRAGSSGFSVTQRSCS